MSDSQEIKFTVTIDEANLILEGLGRLPFKETYKLVGKLQRQAHQQLSGGASGIKLAMDSEEDEGES